MKEKLLEQIIEKQDEIIQCIYNKFEAINKGAWDVINELMAELESLKSQLAEINKATMKDLTDSDEAKEMGAPFDESGCFNPDQKNKTDV